MIIKVQHTAQYGINHKKARDAGYKVMSSTLGHVAMSRDTKWFTHAFKEEHEAWLEVFSHLGLPQCKEEEKEAFEESIQKSGSWPRGYFPDTINTVKKGEYMFPKALGDKHMRDYYESVVTSHMLDSLIYGARHILGKSIKIPKFGENK